MIKLNKGRLKIHLNLCKQQGKELKLCGVRKEDYKSLAMCHHMCHMSLDMCHHLHILWYVSQSVHLVKSVAVLSPLKNQMWRRDSSCEALGEYGLISVQLGSIFQQLSNYINLFI